MYVTPSLRVLHKQGYVAGRRRDWLLCNILASSSMSAVLLKDPYQWTCSHLRFCHRPFFSPTLRTGGEGFASHSVLSLIRLKERDRFELDGDPQATNLSSMYYEI